LLTGAFSSRDMVAGTNRGGKPEPGSGSLL